MKAKTAIKQKYHIPFNKKNLLFFGNIRENKGLDLSDVMQGLKDDYFLLLSGQIVKEMETKTCLSVLCGFILVFFFNRQLSTVGYPTA